MVVVLPKVTLSVLLKFVAELSKLVSELLKIVVDVVVELLDSGLEPRGCFCCCSRIWDQVKMLS